MSRSTRPHTGPPRQIVEAFPEDSAPAHLLRDRDAVYGDAFRQRVKGMNNWGSCHGPAQSVAEPLRRAAHRFTVRRECLDHVAALGERHLRRILTAYLEYYHQARTHFPLDQDAPAGRPVEIPDAGRSVEIPEVGSLHHRYVRQAA